MAWNEPGGNNQGDKDPWGNKNDQGPPELQEASTNLQNHLRHTTGGNSGGSGGSGVGSSHTTNSVMMGGLIILAFVGWAWSGVYTLYEVALRHRLR